MSAETCGDSSSGDEEEIETGTVMEGSISIWKYRILSAERDNRALVKTCADVSSWLGTGLCAAGLTYEPLHTIRAFNSKVFIRTLEATCDGLRDYLMLLVKFLNKMPAVEKAFRTTVRHLKTPVRPMISTLIHQLWERMKFVYERFINIDIKSSIHTENEGAINKVSTCCQTNASTLHACASCQIARNCIRQLATITEAQSQLYNISNTKISETKQSMNDDELLHLTHWGATRRWCTAICNDLSAIYRLKLETDRTNESLNNKIKKYRERGRFRITAYEDKVKLLNIKVKILKNTVRREKSKSNKLNQSIYELSKQLEEADFNYRQANENIQQCEERVLKMKEQLHELSLQCNKYSEQLNESDDIIQTKNEVLNETRTENQRLWNMYTEKVEELNKLLIKTDGDINNFKAKISDLEGHIFSLTKEREILSEEYTQECSKRAVMEKRYQKICAANVSLEKVITEKNDEIRQIHVKLKQLEQEVLNKQEKTVSATDRFTPVSIVGDPVIDMNAQVRANESQIQLLNTQNMKLQSTLTKLYLHKKNKK